MSHPENTPTTEATRYAVERGAAWITLNRPENRNALSAVLVNELDAHLVAANNDPAVRCIVITGTDPAFCAGADLKNPPGQASEGGRAVAFPDVLKRIIDSPKPVIAAVNGSAFAGGLGTFAGVFLGAAATFLGVDRFTSLDFPLFFPIF
jgi:enoyl-CoA hydratase/carnithine racemase